MKNTVCRITFEKGTPRQTLEKGVAEAIFAAECIHGAARVRLGAGYYLSRTRPQCVIDASTEVGDHVARLFAGLMSRELGEESFQVERIDLSKPGRAA